MRRANALIAADYLNRFSNGSPSVIHITGGSDTFFGLALASLYPNSARDPARDLWTYLVTEIFDFRFFLSGLTGWGVSLWVFLFPVAAVDSFLKTGEKILPFTALVTK